MNKDLRMLRIDISYIDPESDALADSLNRNLGLMPSPSLNLILVTVKHGWVFLKGLAGVEDPENLTPFSAQGGLGDLCTSEA